VFEEENGTAIEAGILEFKWLNASGALEIAGEVYARSDLEEALERGAHPRDGVQPRDRFNAQGHRLVSAVREGV
jgi:hypothetical protein